VGVVVVSCGARFVPDLAGRNFAPRQKAAWSDRVVDWAQTPSVILGSDRPSRRPGEARRLHALRRRSGPRCRHGAQVGDHNAGTGWSANPGPTT
jgi:hypothetical protein